VTGEQDLPMIPCCTHCACREDRSGHDDSCSHGDGGIWEELDHANSEVLAEAIVGSSWLAALLGAAEEAERMAAAIREAGIEHPTGAQAIEDLAAMADGRGADLDAARAEVAALRDGIERLADDEEQRVREINERLLAERGPSPVTGSDWLVGGIIPVEKLRALLGPGGE